MTDKKIQLILNQHYIEYEIINGRTYAIERWLDTNTGRFHADYIDTTGWTKKQLYNWLGY